MDRWASQEGTQSPLGVTWIEEEQAFNFALYSKHATGVVLLLYTADDTVTPGIRRHLNYLVNKSGRVWHCRIPASQMRHIAYYAYQVEGPFEPGFDPPHTTIHVGTIQGGTAQNIIPLGLSEDKNVQS